MTEITFFYDDTKKSCQDYADRFAEQENVECKKASEYLDQQMIFNKGAKIGLIFESENGKVPYSILHIIWRLIADKKEKHMIFVTGGDREFRAIKAAADDMAQRGYHVNNIYSKYILQKHKIREDEAVDEILYALSDGHSNVPHREDFRNLSKKELRKQIREEIKAYRKYQKENIARLT